MTDLNPRLRAALGGDWDTTRSPWEGLMKLYEVDREAFYLLACDGPGASLGATFRPLADLAQRTRAAVRATYRLVPGSRGTEPSVQTRVGDSLPIPASLLPAVEQFLLEIDGKGSAEKRGRDYEGRAVSEAEVRFKLGEERDRAQAEQRQKAHREAKPLVFRVSPEDLQSLRSLPAYVTHGLMHCARKTVLAPTMIYRGLNRGEKAPERLRDGWAICGRPSRTYDNAGQPAPAPANMVYMAYADSGGHVFDWDWVEEDPHAPGQPLDAALRFGNPVHDTREMVLELPERIDLGPFDPTRPACSPRGDCVFCYLADAPSFAARINEDLTVFYSLEDREQITGFKIKNVGRILQKAERLNLTDAPGLDVLVLPILRKALHEHQDVTIKLYELIIAALVDVKVPLPQPAPDEAEQARATC
jgi:hypothetical protein